MYQHNGDVIFLQKEGTRKDFRASKIERISPLKRGICSEKKYDYGKGQSSQKSSPNHPRKRFFKRKKKSDSPSKGVKQCRCWLCKAEGHYANECPKRDKRASKILIAEYGEAIEFANLKGLEVAYSDEENVSRPGPDVGRV